MYTDIIIILIIAAVIISASAFVFISRKKGKKCIGCPDASTCKYKSSCDCCCGCGKSK